jgi:Fe-S-cluster containining protein
MKLDLEKYKKLAQSKLKENKKFISKLKQKKPKDLDSTITKFHYETFEKISCLDCANCCKTLGPLITTKDISRISKHLKISENVFIENYLTIDEDNDYIFKSMPCPFLLPDNYCSIYDYRPKACAEYPHTNRRKAHQILNITLKNTITCPAVFEIVENLKNHYSSNQKQR